MDFFAEAQQILSAGSRLVSENKRTAKSDLDSIEKAALAQIEKTKRFKAILAAAEDGKFEDFVAAIGKLTGATPKLMMIPAEEKAFDIANDANAPFDVIDDWAKENILFVKVRVELGQIRHAFEFQFPGEAGKPAIVTKRR